MWRNNKCLFVFGIIVISLIVVLIILGVVTLIVAPALPQLRSTPINNSFNLRIFEDSFISSNIS
jgi:hypothetical protein